MQIAAIEIVADIIVIITVIDFLFDMIVGENIVSVIRKMIRPTDNVYEAMKAQKRVTYFSILFKVVSLCVLVFSTVFLNLSWTELTLYVLATSIFIANITVLVNRALN
jgi:hypothetical protein